MTTATGELPDDLEACHQLIRELLRSLAEQAHLAGKLQHQLELLLRQRYGRKTETVDPAQLLLFAREILAAAEAPAPEPAPPADAPPGPASLPGRGGHGRKPLPAHLPC
jgi:transposase